MKYKLYKNASNNTSNVIKEVLTNRGIDDYNTYLNLNDSVLIPYNKLDNINKSVEVFDNHYCKNDKMGILVDTDVDGFTSASAMYNYIKEMNPDYPIVYIMHSRAKSHGLNDDLNIENDIRLLIIPDAATNDDEKCKQLVDKNIDIIILDHHEMEKENNYATIVNNQISENYSNKSLSGVGIVYKFLQALDDYYWNEYADNYLDLVALGNIADVMDIRSFETRHLINKGLKNINNKCFKAFIQAQDYSMKSTVNIHNVQWYIVPIMNAMIRVGNREEKELLFKSFIETDEYFDYKTKANKENKSEIVKESIYDRSARLSKNAKSRQDKLKEKGVEALISKVNNECTNDKIIIVDSTDEVDNGLTGVAAIKISETFKKPCILLNKHITDNKIVYGGSGRNFNNSPIDSFKDLINECGIFDFAQGHSSAFGIQLQVDKKEEAKNKLNELLKDIVYESVYLVDFVLNINQLSVSIINDIDKLKNIVGQGIDECNIAIEEVNISKKEIEIIGKNNNTITFIKGDIKFVQFNCNNDNKLFEWINDTWNEDECVIVNMVCKPSMNEYNNVKTPQCVIENVEIISMYNINNTDDVKNDESVW